MTFWSKINKDSLRYGNGQKSTIINLTCTVRFFAYVRFSAFFVSEPILYLMFFSSIDFVSSSISVSHFFFVENGSVMDFREPMFSVCVFVFVFQK